MNKGLIHIYTRDGKGKTTASVGLVIRHIGSGGRSAFVQFDKGYSSEEHYNERKVLRVLSNVDLYVTGMERVNEDGGFRFRNEASDYKEAKRGLAILKMLIKNKEHTLVVADELLSAMTYSLIKKEDILNLFKLFEDSGRSFEFVVTGRLKERDVDIFKNEADLMTEMKPLKHYFSEGIKAREGVDF